MNFEARRIDRRQDLVACDLQDADRLDYTPEGRMLYAKACHEMTMLEGLRRMYRQEGRDLDDDAIAARLDTVENLLASAAGHTTIEGVFSAAVDYERALNAPGIYPVVIVDLSEKTVYCRALSEGWWLESLPAWKKRLNVADLLLKHCFETGAPADECLYEIACIIQAAAQAVLTNVKEEITTISQVAEKCGVSSQTIRNRAKRLGIPTGVKLTAAQVKQLCDAGRKKANCNCN